MSKIDTDKLIELCRAYGSVRISLFGSYARGDNSSTSDVDLLVTFQKPISLLALVRLERELEEAIGRKVDLVTDKALSPHMRDRVLAEQRVLYEAA